MEDQRVVAAQPPPDGPAVELTRVMRFLSELYALGLDLDAADYLISAELALALLPPPAPRSGVLAIEEAGELQLGVYLHPNDQADRFTVAEEASHLVCLAWHARQDRPVSPLLLELQGEIDRFLFFCHDSGKLDFACFAETAPAGWLPRDLEARYDTARLHARRYCRGLVERFARRRDTQGLASELRRFYRASPAQKLAA